MLLYFSITKLFRFLQKQNKFLNFPKSFQKYCHNVLTFSSKKLYNLTKLLLNFVKNFKVV